MTVADRGIAATPTLIIAVCFGKICRSLMAEANLSVLLAENGLRAVVISRGLAAPVGRRPYSVAIAIAIAVEWGTPIAASKHAALLTSFEVKIARANIVMEDAHRKAIVRKHPFDVSYRSLARGRRYCRSVSIAEVRFRGHMGRSARSLHAFE